MSSFRIAFDTFQKMFRRPFLILAVLAIIIIPSLYTGLYLYSNIDPYGGAKDMNVAVVNSDKTVSFMKHDINLGDAVAEELISTKAFNFDIVDSGDVNDRVNKGKDAFAIIIPEDFSQNIINTLNALMDKNDSSLQSAKLQILKNDANSYLTEDFATAASEEIQTEVTSKIDQEVINIFIQGMGEIRQQLQEAADGAKQVTDGLSTLYDNTGEFMTGLHDLQDGTKEALAGSQQLSGGLSEATVAVNQVNDKAKDVKNILDKQVGKINNDYNNYENKVYPKSIEVIKKYSPKNDIENKVKQVLLSTLDTLNNDLVDLNTKVSEKNKQLSSDFDKAEQLVKGLNEASFGADQLTSGLQQLVDAEQQLIDGFGQIQDGIKQLQEGSIQLEEGLVSGASQLPNISKDRSQTISTVLSQPIKIENTGDVTASGYAEGLLPFFISLSLWIGAYALFVIFVPLPRRALVARKNALKTTIGGIIPPAVIAILQSFVLLGVVDFGLQMKPHYLIIAILFMTLIAITYTTILHLFMAMLGKVGMFVGLVLLIVQLTSSGGTFPWQTMPPFFRTMHSVLPMGYAVDALRQIFYGGSLLLVVKDSLVFVVYLIIFLILGVLNTLIKRRFTMFDLRPPIE
ncbi:MAG: YhgE/Pip family protein [Candidatus Ancillula sp.]|jgi:putative membrane protein|nr:YhgE/Pip family protein [Candidatus Ancillula sp.]